MSPKKVFRTRYLIDRDFQLKYALLLAFSAVLVSLLLGGNLFFLFKDSKTVLENANLLQIPEIQTLVHHWNQFLRYNLVMILCGTILFLSLLGIFLTHKMAGPIFVLKRKLQEITQGDYSSPMHLRKKDEFQDVKETFNTMLDSLQSRTKKDIEILQHKNPGKIESLLQEKKRQIGET